MGKDNITRKYLKLLQDYYTKKGEQSLLEAADLGRELIKKDVPLEEVAEMHESAIQKLAEEVPDKTLLESVQYISAPLMELLMSYGLALGEITEFRRKSEARNIRLSTAIEQSGESILITDSTGIIEYANPSLEKISGYSLNEVIGKNPRIFKSDEHDDDFYAQMWGTISKGSTWQGRIVNKRKNGDLYHMNSTISPVKDPDGKIINYVAVRRDVTREIELENNLRQAQKMESVGRLAGGVAHDLNNALSVISGFAEIALEETDPEGQMHENINEIHTAAKRAADITRQLLAFARKQTISPKVLDLNESVGNMLKMLRRLIGEDIDFAWMPGVSLWAVKMDPSQIDQILANLCVNARDAIEGVGRVTIESRNIAFAKDYCTDHAGFVPGEFVKLSVGDSGCGMNKKILENIFEPFFTTKDVDKGTGLGLATVYGIVKQNKGFINVYSEPDKGTTINIYLPRHEIKAVEIHEESNEEIPTSQGETILVVEDDFAILNIMQKILERLGYTVLASDAPEKTMDIIKEYTGKIHLLITDVIMPKMNGRDLVEQLQLICPDLKYIFMSGYTANVITRQGVLDKEVNFIQKPFSRRDLAEIVRKVLDENV